MSLKHGLLGLLDYGSMTGYDLSKAFNDSLGFFWPAQTSQIYRELNAMEDRGWLVSIMEFQTDKPNKRIYTITDAGRHEFQSWLKQENAFQEILEVRSRYLMRVFFSARRGKAENAEFFRRTQAVCQAAIQQVEGARQSVTEYRQMVPSLHDPLHWEMTREFGLAYYSMCAQWARQCLKILEEDEG